MKITENADGSFFIKLEPYEFKQLSAAMGYCQYPGNGQTSPYSVFAAAFARAEQDCKDNKIIEKYNLSNR